MVPRQHEHQSLSQDWVEFSVSGEQALSFLPYGATPVSAWSPSQQVLTVSSNQFAGFWFGSTVLFLHALGFFARSSTLTPLPFSAVQIGKFGVNGERSYFRFQCPELTPELQGHTTKSSSSFRGFAPPPDAAVGGAAELWR